MNRLGHSENVLFFLLEKHIFWIEVSQVLFILMLKIKALIVSGELYWSDSTSKLQYNEPLSDEPFQERTVLKTVDIGGSGQQCFFCFQPTYWRGHPEACIVSLCNRTFSGSKYR